MARGLMNPVNNSQSQSQSQRSSSPYGMHRPSSSNANNSYHSGPPRFL